MQDVYFLVMSQGPGGLGAWLRFNKADDSIWAIITLPDDGGIVAHKVQLANPSIYQHFNHLPSACHATGMPCHWQAMPSACHAGVIEWNLRWGPAQQPVRLFPYKWMYRLGWPSTKLETLGAQLRCSGTIKVGGRSFDVRDAPAHLGHTWGSRMAHSWAWAAGSSFGDANAYFEALSARVPICGLLSPPMTLARLHVGDEWYTFCKPGGWLSQHTVWNRGGWRLECREGLYRLVADIRVNPGEVNQPHGGGEGGRAPSSDGAPGRMTGRAPVKVVGVTYDASGTRRYCYNTVLATANVELHCKEGDEWRARHTLTGEAICYEHASPSPDPHLPLHL